VDVLAGSSTNCATSFGSSIRTVPVVGYDAHMWRVPGFSSKRQATSVFRVEPTLKSKATMTVGRSLKHASCRRAGSGNSSAP